MSKHSGSQSGTAPRFAYLHPVISAVTFIRKMRGRSQSLLVEDIDRNLYVLKLRSTPQHSRCLASELLGTNLCHALGFSVPQSCFIQVGDQFLNRYPDAWFQTSKGRIHPQGGLHYGTAFVGAAEGMGRPFELPHGASPRTVINREQFCGMYLFDIWANHLNRRQSLYLLNSERNSSQAVFLDNGLLFGGPLWSFADSEPQAAFRKKDSVNVEWRNEIVQAWFDRFRAVIPQALAQILEVVPSDWCTDGIANLERVLLRRLAVIEEIVEPFTLARQHQVFSFGELSSEAAEQKMR